MDTRDLLSDMTPEELDPRLELQLLTDPFGVAASSNNNLNCAVEGACNIKAGS